MKFWFNAWCGDVILKESFSELYHSAQDNKEASIADQIQLHNESVHWELNFT